MSGSPGIVDGVAGGVTDGEMKLEHMPEQDTRFFFSTAKDEDDALSISSTFFLWGVLGGLVKIASGEHDSVFPSA